MARIMGAPSKYIQGYNEILNIKQYITAYGNKYLFIIDKFLFKSLSEKLAGILAKADAVYEQFNGECSENKISRLGKIYNKHKLEVVVGIGSGKTIDTAKSVAHQKKCAVVICPTAASCDAPCKLFGCGLS